MKEDEDCVEAIPPGLEIFEERDLETMRDLETIAKDIKEKIEKLEIPIEISIIVSSQSEQPQIAIFIEGNGSREELKKIKKQRQLFKFHREQELIINDLIKRAQRATEQEYNFILQRIICHIECYYYTIYCFLRQARKTR